MKDFEKIILAKIKEEKIRPIPRWEFILLNVLMWSLVVLAVILGSLALGVILDVVFGVEWGAVNRAAGQIQGFLLVLPYLWILVLVLALVMAWKVFPHTRQGYRYTPRRIFVGILVFSVVGGTVLWQTRISRHADRWAMDSLPVEMQFEQGLRRRMLNMDGGMLDGFIMEEGVEELILNDIFGDEWLVDIQQIERLPQEKHVLFFGKQTGEFEFMAEKVLTPRGIMPDEFRSKIMKGILEEERNRE